MKKVNDLINTQFGNRLRVRVSAMITREDKILLLKQLTNNQKGFVWLPPGGGMKFGKSITDNIEREIFEETGLIIKCAEFYGITEYLKLPLHSVELFYTCCIIGGNLKLGHDPELDSAQQLIQEFKWFTLDEVQKLPTDEKHTILIDEKLLNRLLSQ